MSTKEEIKQLEVLWASGGYVCYIKEWIDGSFSLYKDPVFEKHNDYVLVALDDADVAKAAREGGNFEFFETYRLKPVGMKGRLRGHDIVYENGQWLYVDTKTPTVGNERACGKCGESSIIKGHEEYDACLGKLPNLMNACCGHGAVDEAYMQHLDGECIRGEEAMKIMNDVITSDEALKEIHGLIEANAEGKVSLEALDWYVKKIFNQFEAEKTIQQNQIEELKSESCEGCTLQPKKGENYTELCGTCKRFYGDFFKLKETE